LFLVYLVDTINFLPVGKLITTNMLLKNIFVEMTRIPPFNGQ